MEKKYTIKDIAEMAGVSKGTVDRVIHKRGRVSEKAHEKITKILEEINFSPNPIAKTLKSNKIYTLGILIPSVENDAYWQPCLEAIETIKKEFQSFSLRLVVKEFDQHSPKSFIEVSEALIAGGLDALIFVPLFNKESKILLDKCDADNILIATFNNAIVTNDVDLQIGQNLNSSGRVAANLFHQINSCEHLAVLHLDENLQNATHMQQKEAGFRNYFKEQKSNPKISTFNIQYFDEAEIQDNVQKILYANPDISGFYITTSKSYLVAPVIPEIAKIDLIGYDLLEANLHLLKTKKLQFLINQNPKLQLYKSLLILIEKLIFDKDFKEIINLPIEVITSENYSEYLD